MDPAWLWRNVERSWRHGSGARDVGTQLLLRYARRLPPVMRRPDWVIGCRFPPPIGELRLRLRDNFGADLFIYSEVLEQQTYRLPLAPPPATILDLGANIGLGTIYFARLFPAARLACVEPVPDNLEILRGNLAMNGVAADVFAAAIDVCDGSATMERAPLAYGHRVVSPAALPSARQFAVPALTVASVLDRLGWDRIGLLKIDVEGHETVLLSQACDWLHRTDAICLEYHAHGGDQHLAEVARRYGFQPPRQRCSGLWLLTR